MKILLKNVIIFDYRYSYLSQIHLDGSVASTFNHHISILLKYFGLNHVWDNKTKLSVPRLIHALKMTMFKRYEEFFFASIKGTFLKDSCNTKLRTYCKFKKTYTFENYLGRYENYFTVFKGEALKSQV